MDGDSAVRTHPEAAARDEVRREHDRARPRAAPATHTLRWLVIVGLLLALVLGGLYGFNRFRERAIATYFAHNKPPPAVISAVTATVHSVPRYASGIGSLAAVRQVTVSPEVGGRVTKIFFTAGQHVKQGDPLVQLNDAPELGDLANYQAQARLAAINLQRAKELIGRNFTPQATVDQDQSQLAQANALIEKTQALIAQKLIRAPFAGRLGLRRIDLGQYLTAGAPIVSLTDLATLHIDFTLPSSMRPQIAIGQTVDVEADAYPGRSFHARITAIEPQVSPDTRTLQVEATMPNPDEALLPGMFVTAKVVLPPQPDQVVVPETAVDYTLYGDAVYVIRPAGKNAKGQPILRAYRQPVKTGPRWGDSVAILSGLKAGERVVAAGQIKIQQDGAEVAISPIAPPPPPAHPTLH